MQNTSKPAEQLTLSKYPGDPTMEVLPLTVQYGQTKRQIKTGRFGYVDRSITAKNSTVRREKVQTEAVIVHFDRYQYGFTTSDWVEKELCLRDLRPGDLDELAAFGKTYPDKQREYPIVALGSVVWLFGTRWVPYLFFDGAHGRGLYLFYRDDWWHGSFRFLAFRK